MTDEAESQSGRAKSQRAEAHAGDLQRELLVQYASAQLPVFRWDTKLLDNLSQRSEARPVGDVLPALDASREPFAASRRILAVVSALRFQLRSELGPSFEGVGLVESVKLTRAISLFAVARLLHARHIDLEAAFCDKHASRSRRCSVRAPCIARVRPSCVSRCRSCALHACRPGQRSAVMNRGLARRCRFLQSQNFDTTHCPEMMSAK